VGKAAELTGRRFGKLVAVAPTGKRTNGNAIIWLCKCDCGGEKETTVNKLRGGRVTHCGCQSRSKDLTGQRFGKLTVIELSGQKSKENKPMWRCVCDCGGEKHTTAASLNSGYVKSCGCINHLSKVSVGDRYGMLTVLARKGTKNQNAMFLCECDCGKEKEYPASWLTDGRVTSCGCSQGVTPLDLTNKRFGRLVALSPTNRRESGSVMWKCRCDCGKITYRAHSNLKKSGENTNCGCLQSAISSENMKKAIHHVYDTCIEKIQSTNLPSNNKSGIKGVFFSNSTQMWHAVIGFQKQQIRLGQYKNKEDAAIVRKIAEETIYKPFLEAYYSSLSAKNEQEETDETMEMALSNIAELVINASSKQGFNGGMNRIMM